MSFGNENICDQKIRIKTGTKEGHRGGITINFEFFYWFGLLEVKIVCLPVSEQTHRADMNFHPTKRFLKKKNMVIEKFLSSLFFFVF